MEAGDILSGMHPASAVFWAAESDNREIWLMDNLSPKQFVKNIPVITSRTESRLGITVLLLIFGTISALKGLNLHVDVTASYFYYSDFRFGFILRGLVGQLFSPILAALPQSSHDGLMIAWHFATLATLLIVLSRFAARMVVA